MPKGWYTLGPSWRSAFKKKIHEHTHKKYTQAKCCWTASILGAKWYTPHILCCWSPSAPRMHFYWHSAKGCAEKEQKWYPSDLQGLEPVGSKSHSSLTQNCSRPDREKLGLFLTALPHFSKHLLPQLCQCILSAGSKFNRAIKCKGISPVSEAISQS